MSLILLTIAVMGIVVLAMSVGVIFTGRCLRGSCGGPDVLGPDGEPLSCANCPKRKLRQQNQARKSATVESPASEVVA